MYTNINLAFNFVGCSYLVVRKLAFKRLKTPVVHYCM